MLSLVKQYDDASEHFKHMVRAYELADRIQDIVVQTPGLFLDEHISRDLYDATNRFVLHYNMLTHTSMERQHLRYNPIFKTHAIIHIAWLSKWQHPRGSWCYIYEDFVGRIKRIALACYHGTKLANIPCKVLSQYRIALAVHVNRGD